MAVQVLDENGIIRTLPEVSEVGARIDEKVQANMPEDGVDGKDGLSIWETTTNTTTGTTSIAISTLNTVAGRSVQVGDYIIGNATYSYLYLVTAVNSTTVTVTYRRTLRGATGSGGSVTVDTALSSTSTNPVQNKVVNTALNGKAPTSHASSATTYGVGNSSSYGHVKLSDSTSSTSSATGGIAATPKAVNDLRNISLLGVNNGYGATGNCSWAGFEYHSNYVTYIGKFGICAWVVTVSSTTQNITMPITFFSTDAYTVLAHRQETADYQAQMDTVKRVDGSKIQMPYCKGSATYYFIAFGRMSDDYKV